MLSVLCGCEATPGPYLSFLSRYLERLVRTILTILCQLVFFVRHLNIDWCAIFMSLFLNDIFMASSSRSFFAFVVLCRSNLAWMASIASKTLFWTRTAPHAPSWQIWLVARLTASVFYTLFLLSHLFKLDLHKRHYPSLPVLTIYCIFDVPERGLNRVISVRSWTDMDWWKR